MQLTKEKKEFDRSGSTMKHIRFEDDLLQLINGTAGSGRFSAWVKEACHQRLKREGIEPKG